MSVPCFAADEPPPKPFYRRIRDDFTLESEKFLESYSKTLIDVDLIVKNTSSLISAVCQALDESENSIFATDSFPADSDFDGGFVPETEFDDLSFVPETEFEDGVESCSGDPRASKLDPSSVTAEELSAMDSPPLLMSRGPALMIRTRSCS